MKQFDVHRAPGRVRAEVPFVVVLQSRAFAHHPRRLVAPLLAVSPTLDALFPDLAPRFAIQRRRVVLDVFQIQSVPRDLLGAPIASLAGDDSADRIIAAIDAVITRTHG